MGVSQNAINLTQASEGLKLTPYFDVDGFGTIGWGHKILPDEHFGSITKEQALILLMNDFKHAEDCIHYYVDVPLNQNQYDALVDFIFNEGWSRFANSTLLRLLNKGDYQGAANEFDKWVYGNGEILDGLVTRRAKEKQLFLTRPV